MVGGLGTVLWHPLRAWTPRQLLVLVPSAPYSWRSHKQRQQLAKARTVELADPDRDQRHGDSAVFVDSSRGVEPCIPGQGEHVVCSPSCLTNAIPLLTLFPLPTQDCILTLAADFTCIFRSSSKRKLSGS